MSLCALTCRWVPGTLDRVFVSSPFGHGEASLSDVRRVLGPGAVHNLYLRGRHHHHGHGEQVWSAALSLGCPVGPENLAPVAAPLPPTPLAGPRVPRPAGGRA